MNLVIHDLSEQEWSEVSSKYEGCEVVSDNGDIKPCAGCFGCWVKNPGECVIKDGYERMGALIHKADEVVVISRYTYGGFSSFIKNVIDRSIGWVLPYFEIYEGEMHHRKRYPEDKPFRFIFRGTDLTEKEKAAAKRYVSAVCRNFHGIVKEVAFEEIEPEKCAVVEAEKEAGAEHSDKVIILNCSMRGDNANTKRFTGALAKNIKGEVESINLVPYLKKSDELRKILDSSGRIVLGMPLYVDGVPSSAVRVMEMMEKSCVKNNKKIYVVANMGLYESKQLRNLLYMVKSWCKKCGYTYGGGLAIGAGEMLGMMMESKDIHKGPTKHVADGMDRLSDAINRSSVTENIYAGPNKFPRKFYMAIANFSWKFDAKKFGNKKSKKSVRSS